MPRPKGVPGQLIGSRAAAVEGVGAPLSSAWTAMYHSRDARDRDVAVTGTVLVPIFQYHAGGDEIVPLALAQALHRRWCAEGVQTRLDLEPGEHITGSSEGSAAAITWLQTGFAGLPEVTNCLT